MGSGRVLWVLLLTSSIAHAQRAPLQSSSEKNAPSTDEALWNSRSAAALEKDPPSPPPLSPASGGVPAGSTLGPWAFMDLGAFLGAGTFVQPEYYGYAGLFTSVSAGWGFDVGPVHLRPSAHVGLAYQLTLPDAESGVRFSATPISLSLAATNLLDHSATGLRLTPAVGLTIPTTLGRSIPLTTPTLALQLERRFGPIEVGLRSEVGKPFYGEYPPLCRFCAFEASPRFNWLWSNGLQAEGWFTDWLSLGVSYAWNLGFGFPVATDQVSFAPGDSRTFVSTTAAVTGRVFFTWAFTKRFGLSFDMSTTQPPLFTDRDGVRRVRFPFLSLGSWADNTTQFFFAFWFRTDAYLSRNWIER
jgi:hypothetical protein